MSLIERVKTALRITNTAFDENEIQPLINSALSDLTISGVILTLEDKTAPLIERAVVLYCKSNFGYDDSMNKFLKDYNSLKIHLALTGDVYGVSKDDVS